MPGQTTVHMQGIGEVLLRRDPRARRLIIRIRPLEGVRITVPQGLSDARALQLAGRQQAWMREQLGRVREMEWEYRRSRARLAALDRREVKRVLAARVERIASLHGYAYNRLTVRNQKTRWGSCSARNNISLNMKIILLPEELGDYIILHELVHTRIKHHGPLFWKEIRRAEPRADALAARLKQYDPHLL